VIAHESSNSQREFAEPFSFGEKTKIPNCKSPKPTNAAARHTCTRIEKYAAECGEPNSTFDYGAEAYSILGSLKVSVGLLQLLFSKLLA
jgi:hypothetical protein